MVINSLEVIFKENLTEKATTFGQMGIRTMEISKKVLGQDLEF